MTVLIDNQQNRMDLPKESIRKIAQAVLNALECPDHELSVVLVDDAAIAELNQTYLQHSGPTNVISFSMQEGEFSQVAPFLLGDVVVSVETAAREAREADLDPRTRLVELLIHGILHLRGYDHEDSPESEALMQAKTDALLEQVQAEINGLPEI